MTASISAVHQLRRELLRETITWCTTSSPFYRDRFAESGEIDDVAQLVRLPMLTRPEVVEHHRALRCDDGQPVAVQHTTGTTGSFLQVYRGPAEQAFVWNFMAAQLEARPAPGPRPLHLVLANAYHGALTPVPSRAYVMSVGVHDQAQAGQARQVLDTEYDLAGVAPRVSVVSGTERMVKALTAYLVADGFDFATSPVRRVDMFGGHVTPRMKRLLARTWHAEITDHYSLTEVFGGAAEIGVGGPWIFDPHVVAEVVHPRTGQPVARGEIGALLLTSLYPFTQQMPLVRYVTGDLVEVVQPPEHEAGLQVRYVGRTPRSIIDISGSTVQPLLLSGPLYELIEALPDVAIAVRFLDLDAGPGLELTGDHRYAVEHTPGNGDRLPRIVVRVGLRYAPWMFPDRVHELRVRLARGLFAAHPELARRVAAHELEFDVEALPADDVAPHDSK